MKRTASKPTTARKAHPVKRRRPAGAETLNPSPSIKLLLEKIKQEPSELLAYYELALAYRLSGQYPDMVKTLNRLLKLAPDSSLAYFLMGLAYERVGESGKSGRAYDQALHLVEDSLREEKAEDAENIPHPKRDLDRFKELYAEDPNYAEIKYYEEMSAAGKVNSEQTFLLGLAYKRLGWMFSAIEAFRQVIKARPDYDEAHFELGNIYKQMNKPQDAVKAYQQAIALKPQNAEPHFQLGLAWLKINKFTEARQELEALQELDPHLAEILRTELAGK